jgi:hypothetical protein
MSKMQQTPPYKYCICDTKDRDDKANVDRKVLTASGSTTEGIFPVVVVKGRFPFDGNSGNLA